MAPQEIPGESQLTNDFLKVARLGSALGFGFMAESIQALGEQENRLVFEFSFWTVLAFVGGAAVSVLFWRLVVKAIRHKSKIRNAYFLISVFAAFAFIYPVKFIPAENRFDTLFGLALAAVVLSAVGFAFWQVKRFLDRDSESND